MTVTFQTTLEDYQAFLRAVKAEPSGGMLRAFIGAIVLQVLFALGDPRILVLERQAITQRLWMLLGSFVLTPIIHLLLVRDQQAKTKKLPLLTKPITLTVDDKGLSENSEEGCDEFLWSSIQHILETEEHFFMLVAAKSGLIVPKRAFDSPSQCAEFGAFIQREWAQHPPNVAPIAPPR